MKNLTILCAPDSFKESMTAKQACDAMEKGIHQIYPEIKVIKVPMADGGEGTVDALVHSSHGQFVHVNVHDPLDRMIQSKYGLLGDKETAVIEMAAASGLELLDAKERNPYLTSTYGTGELILDALDKGVKKLLIGIGGSATNDGGSGMLEALGVRFYDKNNQVLKMNGKALKDVEKIDIKHIDSRLKDVQIDVACDVSNTLCGIEGASYIYGPQKGANCEMVENLDKYLKHYAEIIKKDLKMNVLDIKGGGAAGGLGVALFAFMNAKLQKGIDLVIKYSDLENKLKDVDLVLTAEGKIDHQTRFGKTPVGVSLCALRHNIKTIAFAGKVAVEKDEFMDCGMIDIYQITPNNIDLETALKEGQKNLEKTVSNFMKTYKKLAN